MKLHEVLIHRHCVTLHYIRQWSAHAQFEKVARNPTTEIGQSIAVDRDSRKKHHIKKRLTYNINICYSVHIFIIST